MQLPKCLTRAHKSLVVILAARVFEFLYEQAKNNVTVNAALGTWDEVKIPQYPLTGEVFGRQKGLVCLF